MLQLSRRHGSRPRMILTEGKSFVLYINYSLNNISVRRNKDLSVRIRLSRLYTFKTNKVNLKFSLNMFIQ